MSRQVILNFHGLREPPAGVDADERPYWVPVSLFEELVARTDRREDVLLTFDDGNRSDIDLAAPILRRHGRTAWIYVLTGRLGRDGYLTAGDVAALRDMGKLIGLHGRDHLDWRTLEPAQLLDETVDARQVLSELVQAPIETVSIPFGAYNRRLLKHLQGLGYRVILTTDGGAADDKAQIRARTSIRSDMTSDKIEQVLAGRLPPLALARRAASGFAKRRLI